MFRGRMVVKLFIHFQPLCLRYSQRTAARPQIGDFGDTFKTLTISQLNFIDTCFIPKMGLKEPERTCKRATVEAQLCPFRRASVALSQTRRTQTGNRSDFFGLSRPFSLSVWRFLARVFLLRLFVVVRHFAETSLIRQSGIRKLFKKLVISLVFVTL